MVRVVAEPDRVNAAPLQAAVDLGVSIPGVRCGKFQAQWLDCPVAVERFFA